MISLTVWEIIGVLAAYMLLGVLKWSLLLVLIKYIITGKSTKQSLPFKMEGIFDDYRV